MAVAGRPLRDPSHLPRGGLRDAFHLVLRRRGDGRRLLDGLAQAEIRQLHVSESVQEEVVWLDVSVNVRVPVNALQRQHRFRDVELRLSLREGVPPHQQRHHIAPRQIFGHQVQEVLVLEGVVELHDVRGAHFDQNVALGAHVLDLAPPEHLRLLQLLHRLDLPRRFLPHDADLAESPAADDGERLEVVRAVALAHEARVLRLLPSQVLHRVLLGLPRQIALLLELPLQNASAHPPVSKGLGLRLVHLLDVLLRGRDAPLRRVARLSRRGRHLRRVKERLSGLRSRALWVVRPERSHEGN